ncbi:MAG: sigma-70 family RNA polymerase sigma factor [Betaproteobacteria bacterium]
MARREEIETLLARVGQGDRRAFEALYELTAGVLLTTADRVLHDRGAAEDVVHDVFAGLWHGDSTPRAPAVRSFAWLCVVTRNKAIDRLRRQPPELPLQLHSDDGDELHHDAPSDAPGVFEQLRFEEDERQLRACLERLEAGPRQALLLAYAEGLSHGELSARLRRPLGTVKAWTRRSLLSLRACMEAA